MTNPWKNMDTTQLYGALTSPNPERAIKELAAAKRALNLAANRARIKAGHRLMNEFHRRVNDTIETFKEEYGENYIDELRACPDLLGELVNDELIKQTKDYLEYCYD